MPSPGFTRRSSYEREVQPVAIVSVDPISRTAIGVTRTRHSLHINCAYATGDTITVPATGEQWYCERFDMEWRLYGRIPFNDPTLNITPEVGQVSVGGALGPLELNGTEARINAPVFRLGGVYYRDSGTGLERSTDQITWTAIGATAGIGGIVQLIAQSLTGFDGTDQTLALLSLENWAGILQTIIDNFSAFWNEFCQNVFVAGLKRMGFGETDLGKIVDGFQNFVNYLFGVIFCDFDGDLTPQTILARLRDLLAPIINNPFVIGFQKIAQIIFDNLPGNLLNDSVLGLTGLTELIYEIIRCDWDRLTEELDELPDQLLKLLQIGDLASTEAFGPENIVKFLSNIFVKPIIGLLDSPLLTPLGLVITSFTRFARHMFPDDDIQGAIDGLMMGISKLIETFFNFLTCRFDKILEDFQKIITFVDAEIDRFGAALPFGAGLLMKFVRNVFIRPIMTLTEELDDIVLLPLGLFFGSFIRFANKFLPDGETVEGPIDGMMIGFTKLLEIIFNIIRCRWDLVLADIQKACEFVVEELANLTEGQELPFGAGAILDFFKKTFIDPILNIEDTISSVTGPVFTPLGNLLDSASLFAKSLLGEDKISGLLDGMIVGFSQFIETVFNLITCKWDKVNFTGLLDFIARPNDNPDDFTLFTIFDFFKTTFVDPFVNLVQYVTNPTGDFPFTPLGSFLDGVRGFAENLANALNPGSDPPISYDLISGLINGSVGMVEAVFDFLFCRLSPAQATAIEQLIASYTASGATDFVPGQIFKTLQDILNLLNGNTLISIVKSFAQNVLGVDPATNGLLDQLLSGTDEITNWLLKIVKTLIPLPNATWASLFPFIDWNAVDLAGGDVDLGIDGLAGLDDVLAALNPLTLFVPMLKQLLITALGITDEETIENLNPLTVFTKLFSGFSLTATGGLIQQAITSFDALADSLQIRSIVSKITGLDIDDPLLDDPLTALANFFADFNPFDGTSATSLLEQIAGVSGFDPKPLIKAITGISDTALAALANPITALTDFFTGLNGVAGTGGLLTKVFSDIITNITNGGTSLASLATFFTNLRSFLGFNPFSVGDLTDLTALTTAVSSFFTKLNLSNPALLAGFTKLDPAILLQALPIGQITNLISYLTGGTATTEAQLQSFFTNLRSLLGNPSLVSGFSLAAAAAGLANVLTQANLVPIINPYTVTIAGNPTGGSFTLSYTTVSAGVSTTRTTSAIAYSTTAATTAANIQTALTAAGMTNVGAGNASVTATSATVYSVSIFHSTGTLALGTSSLTGGTSPTVTVAKRSFIDLTNFTPQNLINTIGTALQGTPLIGGALTIIQTLLTNLAGFTRGNVASATTLLADPGANYPGLWTQPHVAHSATGGRVGGCLSMTSAGPTTERMFFWNVNDLGAVAPLSLAPTESVYCECYVKLSTTLGFGRIALVAQSRNSLTGAVGAITNVARTATFTSATRGTWVLLSGYFTQPTGFDQISVGTRLGTTTTDNNTTSGDVFLIDDMIVRPNITLTNSTDLRTTLNNTVGGLSGTDTTGANQPSLSSLTTTGAATREAIAALGAAVTELQNKATLAANSGASAYKEFTDFAGFNTTGAITYTGTGSGALSISGQQAVWTGTADPDTYKFAKAVYTSLTTDTDYQQVGIAFASAPAQDFLTGANRAYNYIIGRSNSTGSEFVFAKFANDHYYAGYSINGVETNFTLPVGQSWPLAHAFLPGSVYWLECGTEAGLTQYRVKRGGVALLTVNSTAYSSYTNSTHRQGGFQVAAKGVNAGIFGTWTNAPGSMAAFAIADNSPGARVGSGMRRYRSSTTATAITLNGDRLLADGFFDQESYMTDDYTYTSSSVAPNVYKVTTPGWYEVKINLGLTINTMQSDMAPTLYRNGSLVARGPSVWGVSQVGRGPSQCAGTFQVYMNKDDYIQPGYWMTTIYAAGGSFLGDSNGYTSYIQISYMNGVS